MPAAPYCCLDNKTYQTAGRSPKVHAAQVLWLTGKHCSCSNCGLHTGRQGKRCNSKEVAFFWGVLLSSTALPVQGKRTGGQTKPFKMTSRCAILVLGWSSSSIMRKMTSFLACQDFSDRQQRTTNTYNTADRTTQHSRVSCTFCAQSDGGQILSQTVERKN